MPALIGPIGTVVNMNQAVFGNALGNPAYASQLLVAEAVGGQAQIIANYNSQLASSPAAALATTVMNNLFITVAAGVPAANVTALTAALTQAFNTYPTAKGQVINNLSTLLGTLETDPNWGPAARAFNSQAAADYTYSINPANTNAGTPSTTTTFTLTNGIDTFAGSTGNDFFSGSLNEGGNVTFQAFDMLTGGLGTDTLVAQGIGNLSTTTTTLQSVENIQLYAQAAGTTLDLTNTSGVQSVLIANSAGAATVAGINAGVTSLAVTGNPTVGTDDARTFTVASLAAGASVNLVVDGVGDTNTTLNQDNDTININPVSGAVGFSTVSLTAQGSASFVTLNDGDATNLATVNASGSAALVLNLTPTTITTVNAGTMTGAFTVTVGAGALNITGGSGNDNINMAGTYTTTDTINGGSGTDTLWLTASEATTTTSQTSRVTNIELIRVTNATSGTLTLANWGATGAVITTADSGGTIVYSAGAGSLNLGTTDLTSDTINATGNLASDADTLNITLGSSSTANTAGGTVATTNFEVINVTTLGGTGGMAAISTSPTAGTTVNFVGSQGGNYGTVTAATINAGGLTLSSATATGVTLTAGTASSVTGSGGVDAITGSSSADTLRGGAGADTIIGAGGNDLLVGGLGADTLALIADTGATVVTGTAVTVSTSAADSFIGAASSLTNADAIRLDDVATASGTTTSYTVTINTGVVATTVAASSVVSLGTTTVTAFGYLVGASATTGLTADAILYQDTNGNGILEVGEYAANLDLSLAGAEAFAVTIVGGAAVVTVSITTPA